MKIKLLVVCCFTTAILFSQKQKRTWNEGPLSWNDFTDKQMQIHGSIPDFHFNYSPGYLKNLDRTYIVNKPKAYITKKNSYVTQYSKSPQILDYHQVEFNIIEIYRRTFQKEILEILNEQNIESRYQEILQEIEYSLYQYRESTLYGSRKKEIQDWTNRTEEHLKTLHYYFNPELVNSPWEFGGYFGYEFSLFAKAYKEYLNYNWGFSIGFTIDYKKSSLLFDATAINSSLKKDLVLDKSFQTGNQTQFSQITASYGYAILDKSKFRITPFIGIGGTVFIENTDQENRYYQATFSYNYGLNFDYIFSTIYNLIPDHTNKTHKSKFYIRTSIFVNNSTFTDDFNGNTINLGIIFGMSTNRFNKKQEEPLPSKFSQFKDQ